MDKATFLAQHINNKSVEQMYVNNSLHGANYAKQDRGIEHMYAESASRRFF
jgi:hypothetical protein